MGFLAGSVFRHLIIRVNFLYRGGTFGGIFGDKTSTLIEVQSTTFSSSGGESPTGGQFDGIMAMQYSTTLQWSSICKTDQQMEKPIHRKIHIKLVCGMKCMPTVTYAIKSSILPQTTDENEKTPDFNGCTARMISPAVVMGSPSYRVFQQPNTVGIIGGASAMSTVGFMKRVVEWSSMEGEESLPLLVCSDPQMRREISLSLGGVELHSTRRGPTMDDTSALESLREKRMFLERSGACCIVMPCHIWNAWYEEISQGCSVPFLHMGECVARELKEAKLRPVEAGSNLRIGVLGTEATLRAGFYQEKLIDQGFEAVLPDKATMEHVVLPATEALQRKDIEGARNLLRIALQVLLVSAVNTVVLASHDMLALLTPDDPLLKKCIDPIDALARATIKWSHSAREIT